MLKPGAAILIPSGPESDPDRMHLHIVVARKSGPPAQVLLVSICSIPMRHYDDTTTLDGNEHPFLKHPSYIKYRAENIRSEAQIERGIENGIFLLKDDCDEQLLRRIQKGFYSSKFVKLCDRDFLEESD